MTDVVEQKLARAAEMQRLGTVVKSLRLGAGLSQQLLADQMGVHRTTIVRLEAGSHDIGASHLPKLAQALGVGVAALLPG